MLSNRNAIEEFITKLGKFYGKITEGMQEMLVEDLQPYTPSQIRAGYKKICYEKTSKPNVGFIIDTIAKMPRTETRQDGLRDPIDGEMSNGQVCTCGKHHGVNMWNPEEKAKDYAWRRDNYTTGYTDKKRNWLESYERAHGRVK